MKKLIQKKINHAFRFLMALILCGGIAVPSSHAQAEGNILDRIDEFMTDGPLQQLKIQALKNYGLAINPYFKMAFELTDNVFKRPEPNRQDVLWTYTPGVNITHTSELGEVGLSYEASFRYFTRHELQNEQDQAFAAYANLFPTERLNLQISEELVQQGATAGAQGIEPVDYLDNTVKVAAIYAITDRFSGELGYTNFAREYGELYNNFSYEQNEVYVRAHKDLLDERTRVYTGYHLGAFDYDDNPSRDAVYHEFPAGIQGEIPGGINYDAKVAAHIRNQEADFRNDFWAFVGGVELSKEILDGTEVAAGFLRQPVEATYNGAPFYDQKLWYANLTHRFTRKLRGRADISFGNNDYEHSATVGGVTVKRDDDVFSLGFGVDYAMRRWLILNVDYRVERQDSNISAFDYTENRLVLGMTMPL